MRTEAFFNSCCYNGRMRTVRAVNNRQLLNKKVGGCILYQDDLRFSEFLRSASHMVMKMITYTTIPIPADSRANFVERFSLACSSPTSATAPEYFSNAQSSLKR